ncbi:vitelline membrane outer layer protein 1 homolog [Dendrobates tinctorius]|uniref:vitelline membrane outer layer protein 1 homolog n=1 Tax=Dendrobates tinctorius TaxID=92724 RepID=UPI003CC9529F
MTIYHQLPSKWILHTENKMLLVILLLVTLQNSEAAQTILSVPNGVPEGDCGPMEVEKWQDILDDTGLNGISLHCTKPSSLDVLKKITSKEGDFGKRGKSFTCKLGYLTSFVESNHTTDNKAANNIKFTCSDDSIEEEDGQEWETMEH